MMERNWIFYLKKNLTVFSNSKISPLEKKYTDLIDFSGKWEYV